MISFEIFAGVDRNGYRSERIFEKSGGLRQAPEIAAGQKPFSGSIGILTMKLSRRSEYLTTLLPEKARLDATCPTRSRSISLLR
jgi:hypothetical protein